MLVCGTSQALSVDLSKSQFVRVARSKLQPTNSQPCSWQSSKNAPVNVHDSNLQPTNKLDRMSQFVKSHSMKIVFSARTPSRSERLNRTLLNSQPLINEPVRRDMYMSAPDTVTLSILRYVKSLRREKWRANSSAPRGPTIVVNRLFGVISLLDILPSPVE